METDTLRLFVLAADKLNISAAGRELGLAPSVASAWMNKLEKRIGADLLHRSTRKVALSTEGLEFLPYARDIVAREDAARAALGQGRAQVSGTLRFTAPSTFAQLYIAPILPDFIEVHPELSLDLRLSDKQFDLIDGSFDLALRNAALEDSTLRGRKLADDTRVLCASPEYLKNHGHPKSPEELGQHRLVAFGNDATLRMVKTDGTFAEFNPNAGRCNLVIDDGHSHKIATLAGAGISPNSLWSIHKELSSGDLVRVLPEYECVADTALWLIYPQANVLSAKVRIFMDFLLERIGRSPAWIEKVSQ
ncbi:LysR family transcriptional regulator [Ruegeria sp. Ofav3-42]|uniref:LysR family transcriptional regulator n=1 Tax=Ruegeria sp. Ofav3-42 TaxID=2917759 RepID=UPI001EF3D800|nr:LysR family transcriptional regulator [Ruegeria sp. Ofav3-42]MCG7521635.1 LysR family transcriptional regulator [Ruegeria sp. Ofav3-42]